MPAFSLETNVAVGEDKMKRLLSSLTDIVAETLEKPKSYVAVKVTPDCSLSFGGTEEAAALCSLHSIGRLNQETNTILSGKVCALLETELEVSSKRYYLNFVDMEGKNVGFNKTVF